MESYSFEFSAANVLNYTNKLDEKSEILPSKIKKGILRKKLDFKDGGITITVDFMTGYPEIEISCHSTEILNL